MQVNVVLPVQHFLKRSGLVKMVDVPIAMTLGFSKNSKK